jgi:hypothetical protein
MSKFPLLFFVPVIVFISLCSLSIRSFNVIVFRDGINPILVGININPMPVIVQLISKLISGTENFKMLQNCAVQIQSGVFLIS